MESIRIETPRFVLRPLEPDDASERYAAWFDDPEVKRHVLSASARPSVGDLRDYIAFRAGRPDVLFLGVHARDTGAHIGNIKFEPVDSTAGRAVLGIMIGDPAWRGRGAAAEVIVAANEWLAAHRGIREVVLGVAPDNRGAKRAYEKAGFRVTGRDDNDPRDWIRMLWQAGATPAPDAFRHWQIVIFLVGGKANHAGLSIPGHGLADLSLHGARVVPWGAPSLPKGEQVSFDIALAHPARALEHLQRPGLLHPEIIKQEKASKGWHLTEEAPDFIRKLRSRRSSDPEDMNCVEWIVHALELGGLDMPPDLLTPADLLRWCRRQRTPVTSAARIAASDSNAKE